MKKFYFFVSALIFGLILAYSCDKRIGLIPKEASVPITGDACDSIKYSVDIQPILTANCLPCHGSSAQDFSNYTGTKVWVDNGKFELRVLTLKDMPLGSPLSSSDLDKIKCWFDKGTPNN